MGVLSRFERRLGGLVEGAFAKVFKGGVEPVELAGALREETDSRRVISATRTLVPNDFLIELSSRDHEHLVPYEQALAIELAEIVKDHAADQRYTFVGNVRVRFARNDSLDTGIFTVSSGVIGPTAGVPGRPGWSPQVPHGARPAGPVSRPGRCPPPGPDPCRTRLAPRIPCSCRVPGPRTARDLWARPPGPPGEGPPHRRRPGPAQGGTRASAPRRWRCSGWAWGAGRWRPSGSGGAAAGWLPAGQPAGGAAAHRAGSRSG